jgi:hypothetical protein
VCCMRFFNAAPFIHFLEYLVRVIVALLFISRHVVQSVTLLENFFVIFCCIFPTIRLWLVMAMVLYHLL